ncbi:saccharopine dehydrogenase, partial [Trypanosoma grayi]|uniref:saccharopine dehydrogenase n=1 Tax=Trypanosoma grayi TaxID=71804 RepID=UPI0004F41B78
MLHSSNTCIQLFFSTFHILWGAGSIFFFCIALPKKPMSRELAVVVLGATGYTGQLVCEYLAGLGRSVVGPWAIAGRSEAKLNKLRSELGGNVSVLAADFSDASSLDNVCSRTSVLISCAGPFTQVGMPVVE